MPYNLHRIKRAMTPFKMWRGIKTARIQNKVNLIFIRIQAAVWINEEQRVAQFLRGIKNVTAL